MSLLSDLNEIRIALNILRYGGEPRTPDEAYQAALDAIERIEEEHGV